MTLSGKKTNDLPGERVSRIRKRYNWTQEQLADTLHVEPNYISMIETGNRKLPVKRAKEIASLFPPLRYQYFLCEDDYETDSDLLDALIDGHKERYEKRINALRNLASIRGFEIALYSSGIVIGPSGGYEDIYKIERDGKAIYASYSEIMDWIEDISDYVELKMNRQLKQKGGSDNGKYSTEI